MTLNHHRLTKILHTLETAEKYYYACHTKRTPLSLIPEKPAE